MLIEQVLHQAEDLEILRDLVRAVQVDHLVGRHLRILVARVGDQVLAADDVEIGADRPAVGDLILGAGLEAMLRDARNVVAGRGEDVAAGVGSGIVRRRGGECVWNVASTKV